MSESGGFLSTVIPVIATGTPSFTSPTKPYDFRVPHLVRKNEDLEMRLKSKEQDFVALEQEKEELQGKVNGLEDKVLTYKQRLLVLEKKIAEFESDKDLMSINEAKQNNKLEY